MKQFFLIFIIVFVSCNPKDSSSSLTVMTYNLRLDVASDGDNAWPNRSDFLISQLRFFEPNVFGTQEGRPHQIKELKQKLTNYNFIGTGREGKNKGEYSAIFYDTTQVAFTNAKTFWLSNTPNKFSKGWDAAYPRICTYGLMTHLKTNEKFWVFNTHLDHKGSQAQLKGMHLIEKEIEKVNTQNYPVILMGDFNVLPESQLIKTLKTNFFDTKELAGDHAFGAEGTFNGFNFTTPVTRRIDYIMVSKKNLNSKVKKYAVLTDSKDLKYPSDHFPVFVELDLNNK